MPDLALPDTVRVSREAVSCRLLDSALTDADKDFLRAAVVRNESRGIYFRNSARLRELLQLENGRECGVLRG